MIGTASDAAYREVTAMVGRAGTFALPVTDNTEEHTREFAVTQCDAGLVLRSRELILTISRTRASLAL